ncbi:IS200/IS605 family transposase [Chlorogloeopsis sp. ULAP01]|uniref:IS200/IS605 family transposase n=1 Tax=Chlorogloeopsis sp. ULAP01 TaxID=3056483 RepID=UPI0025AABF59|nr:IS200/IS605 family transposase [Chlorogloeopsis sp. ULAP01]MDM9379736.1 IS200/IS605 family transposase [Chlorogloeopsis sp. ULAP01]
MKTKFRKASHAVFSIHLHVILVAKYRKDVITQDILSKLQEVLSRVCEKRKCMLLEFSGEENHVHLLIDFHPDNNISQLVGSLKSASSRIIRKEFQDYLKSFYWKAKDPSFWTDAYSVVSVGGAPLEIVKEYIRAQEKPAH